MDPTLRQAFNAAYTTSLADRYLGLLDRDLGPFTYRRAETPLFIDRALREQLVRATREIVEQLSAPACLARLQQAIPPSAHAPGMSPRPDCVQVDFGLMRTERGEIEGRVVELQAFPSIFALNVWKADAWAKVLANVPGMPPRLTCFLSGDRASNLETLRTTILGGERPEDVVLVDLEPERQKTRPDFIATHRLFGVDRVCVTAIRKHGRTLLREKDGKWIAIRRIYNRLVFDELQVRGVELPFAWTDELDISWCSHPNWYWVWSKYSLPHLRHPTVPEARYLSDVDPLPDDLAGYVLKPLFSFAGSGVSVDVTTEQIAAIPPEQRHQYLLQRKIDYAPLLCAPDGAKVKVEIRVMLLRSASDSPLEPLLMMVRLSRGKMLGVDQNKAAETMWTGATVGLWPLE